MKKTLFLFLIFSSILFGNLADTNGTQVEIGHGNNTGNTPISTTIDINVTVNVAPRGDGLLLVDANDREIASVDFAHDLIQGNLADQLPSEVNINTTIYAKASYLTEANSNSINLPTSENYSISKVEGAGETIGMNLTSAKGTFLNSKLPINITSSVKSNTPTPGKYKATNKKFTVNFSPTGNKF